jgi:hypothetical protein
LRTPRRHPTGPAQIPLPAMRTRGPRGDAVSALTGWHSLANGTRRGSLAALVAVRCRPRESRARLACGGDTAAGRPRDVPLVPPGRMDARSMPRTASVPSEESQV